MKWKDLVKICSQKHIRRERKREQKKNRIYHADLEKYGDFR